MAAAGNLDLGFSGDGTRTTAFGTGGDIPGAVAIRGDGRIVVGGESYADAQTSNNDFAFASFKPHGALDPSFSNDGRRTLGFASGSHDSVEDMAIQADGRIVAVGTFSTAATGDLFAVSRLKPNGDPDQAFSGDGRRTFGFGNGDDADQAFAVALQRDGKIVVAGYSDRGGGNSDFAVARLNPSGSFDTSFSQDGRRTVSFNPTAPGDVATSLELRRDGRVVVAGNASGGTTGLDFAVARLNSNGGLDNSFSNDGRQTVAFGGDNRSDTANGVAIRSDGKLVLGGYSSNPSTGGDFAVARLGPGGGIDNTFSGDGRNTIDFDGASDIGHAMALQDDGRIVVVGQVDQNMASRMGVARFNPGGGIDNSFSGDGRRFIALPGEEISEANAVAIRGGRIVVVGDSYFGSARDYDFGVAVLHTG